MSIHVLSEVLRRSPAKLGARLVHIALAEFAHDDGSKAFPSVETLQERTLLSRRGVQDALRKLESEGLVVQTGETRTGTRIYTVLPGGADSARGAENDAGGAQIPARRGATAAPDPSENREGDPSAPTRTSPEEPEFGEWIGHHAVYTSSTVPKLGTKGRAHIAAMYAARRAEGISHDDLKLAVIGAYEDEYRRQHGYFDPESCLRPTKVHKLIEQGRRHRAAREGSTDWSRFDDAG